jgi:prefoldin alpha subunit
MVSNVERPSMHEIEMLRQYLAEYGQQIELLDAQLGMIEQRRLESLAAVETLSALLENPGESVLLQIGGGASLRVQVTDPDRILLNIGSDVILGRTNAEAVEYLRDRAKEMEALEQRIAGSLDQLQKQANEITRRIETAYRNAQQGQAGQ